MRSYTVSRATISRCGRYRYALERRWDVVGETHSGYVLWVMLNPSTADGATDDATIRRCVGFTRAWGYGWLKVGNLFAYRATDPRELQTERRWWANVVGPRNDGHLRQLAVDAALIVCAWGGGALKIDPRRAGEVITLLSGLRQPCYLALTARGDPGHPLRLSSRLRPKVWRRPKEVT